MAVISVLLIKKEEQKELTRRITVPREGVYRMKGEIKDKIKGKQEVRYSKKVITD
jgi:hypothetical protein